MPDAESETRVCPFCKEEVKATAVRCKHCLADLTPTRPDHGGVCPLCREEINAEAIRCKHCKAELAPGVRDVLTLVPRPSLIMRRRPFDEPVELRGRRRSSDSAGGCAAYITHRGMTYHLVDEGTTDDGWHYCGYEPGYGVFE